MEHQHFRDRYPDPAELPSATREDVGIALLTHVRRTDAGRHAPNNLINEWVSQYRQDGRHLPNDAMLSLAEGLDWLRETGLVVSDPRDTSGPWKVLSRAGRAFKPSDLDHIKLQKILPEFMLHPVIRSASLAVFNAGKLDAAVFEAFRTLEVAIRDAAGFGDADYGTDMIGRAFNSERGPLRDARRSDAERQALARMMTGAHGFLKNPRSHRDLDLADPLEAAEMLVIASHLMRIVEERATARAQAQPSDVRTA